MTDNLKDAVLKFAEDLTTIETAVVKVNTKNPEKADVLSYSKLEFEGDSINYINKDNSEEILQLHREMLLTSVRGRSAFWKFVGKALQ